MKTSPPDTALVCVAVLTVTLTRLAPCSAGASATINEFERPTNCAGLPGPKSTVVTDPRFCPKMNTTLKAGPTFGAICWTVGAGAGREVVVVVVDDLVVVVDVLVVFDVLVDVVVVVGFVVVVDVVVGVVVLDVVVVGFVVVDVVVVVGFVVVDVDVVVVVGFVVVDVVVVVGFVVVDVVVVVGFVVVVVLLVDVVVSDVDVLVVLVDVEVVDSDVDVLEVVVEVVSWTTVSVAAAVVAEPAEFVNTASYFVPLAPSVTFGTFSVPAVAPEIGV